MNEETQNEEFGFLSTALLAASLLLPTKAPEKLPQVNSARELRTTLNSKYEEAKKSGDQKLANYYDLMQATISYESKWDPKAYNGSGGGFGANGLFQIRKCMIDDVNRVYNTKYTKEDAYDINKAAEIYRLYYNIQNAYLHHYKPGAKPTADTLAGMYNQGCSLVSSKSKPETKSAAKRYWNKVKSYLHNKSSNFSERLTGLVD